MLWPFDYHRPETAAAVSELLAAHPDARLLAGGTNLLIDMTEGRLRPDHVIDLKAVEGLSEVQWRDDGSAWIGAAAPLNRTPPCGGKGPACVGQAVLTIATHQIRNRATAVGNLCYASPAADMAPPLMVLGALMKVREPNGTVRSVAMEDFFFGVKRSTLQPGEWVVGVQIPEVSPDSQTAFRKKQRVRGHDLAQINMAGLCDRDRKQLRLSIGACATVPLLLNLDELYAAHQGTERLAEAVTEEVQRAIQPISDVRSSAEYRRDMASYFTRLILADIEA